MTCHCCAGECKKAGKFHNRNRTVQRFACLRCGKTFSESQPLEGVRIETKQAAQVVRMLCEGIGIRAIARLTGLHQETVLNILASAGEHCARLFDAKVRDIHAAQVEVDELHGFVLTKQQNTPYCCHERGDQWTFLAMDRESKLVIAFLVGKRTRENCEGLLEQARGRIAGRFMLSTDGFASYPAAVKQVCGNTVDYGTEVKHFAPPVRRFGNYPIPRPLKCDYVCRTPVYGNPPRSLINTSRAERLNLSFRLFNRRITRHTLGYSKKLANLRHSVALLAAFYNFCRVHSTHGKTPAQAAGLTDRAWTVEELLAAKL